MNAYVIILAFSNIALWVIGIVSGLFLKNYFPSYMDKKGENLATKEDIAEITRKTEEVQKEFKEKLEVFLTDLRFKYDFYYKQYSELYCQLYAIIMQSEYVKYFINLSKDDKLNFENYLFVKIDPTKKETTTLNVEQGQLGKVTRKVEILNSPISDFNQNMICEAIINNGKYATPKLLRLAIAYRFVTDVVSGEEHGKDEEFRLIKEIIKCIVSEFNFFRKELKMDYSENELNTGIPEGM